jgi:hypothetical protein
MSIAFAKKALQRFLADPSPEVLCIKGNWGVGKTYTWDQAIKEAVAEKAFASKKYAYVSLFGMKDSSDIFQSIFAIAESPYPTEYERSLPNKVGGLKLRELELGKKFRSLLGFTAEHATIPHIAGLGGVARAVLSSFVHDTLVCIDDFERKGASVSVNEIMGVIAQLRDSRGCKVAFILNEDSLDEKERSEFHRYSEKVINRTIRFLPTEAESAAIAFPASDPLSKQLREHCERLSITNIRIMFKIRAAANDVMEIIKAADEDIRRTIFKSLVVLVWAATSPPGGGAPTISYLTEKREKQTFRLGDEQYSQSEIEWGVTLDDYGFSHCDELDLAMIEGVKNGFFDDERIEIEIKKLLQNTTKIRAEAALEAAWGPFHDSFDDNTTEVAKILYKGCSENITHLTPVNLSSAVGILKDLGFVEDAKQLLDAFMAARGEEEFIDLSEYTFRDHVIDPDVVAVFAEKTKDRTKRLPQPLDAARRIRGGSWNPEDEESLENLSIDDFVTAFKSLKGKERRDFIFGSLFFRRLSGPTARQKRIFDNAQAALVRIGQETPLNAHRLRAYRIELPTPDQPAQE